MSRVVYPARETVTEIRGEDATEIINKMMEKEGMTQIQLAQKMGITRQRVSRLISGNRAKLLTNTQVRVIIYT